mmetsp:Transcript_22380/g.48860  ORF Transcript_22380/g.48860 Transcript_22380/m.48860 type:complete len:415 (+) Transcript_22380:33-1277(+)|eukprot:CAMPEP_0204270762 /NCGR_PEP_ID=MMETSP0468-20130131/19077_1 /ASSEMBLY_ACC=CAM_ASM_000383 /TAXON_ID=2969 /ORGANISM="Oxyrrhis marina" /LENGTH=414 /DNA_ID=CAMNT_0051246337 /DNA_START=13 /DNA_END=1257 /DNA_ORIENTATION=-
MAIRVPAAAARASQRSDALAQTRRWLRTGYSSSRSMNFSAGNAPLPLEVLERAQKEFVNWAGRGVSILEMGYRTDNFREVMADAEEKFRRLQEIPDDFEVHFLNGGATLQFAAVPMNLLGKPGRWNTTHYKTANYIRSGHWSEKARDEARMYCHVHEVCKDPKDLYFGMPDPKDWDFEGHGVYCHYTAADTRQGFEFQQFPFEVVPKGQWLVCDASANLGSKPWDWKNHDVVYAAAHKNFSTSGVCYTVIRKSLITEDVLPGTPTMCNWNRFQTAPDKVWTVPVTFSVWLGKLTCEWMLERGGLPAFEDLAIRRSNLLYDAIDNSQGFYNTFVTDPLYRSRMQVVFTIRDGMGKNEALVSKFLEETDAMGWLDVRSHPLGIPSDAIRITMYNPQPIEAIEVVREFLHDFQRRHE